MSVPVARIGAGKLTASSVSHLLLPAGATAAGAGAWSAAPVPLKLEPRGKGISCIDMLETIPPNTLASGDYRLDVTVMHPNGDVIARDAQPLTVR